MSQAASEHSLLALICERIVERFRPLRVILFGSHARGEATADSDFDLLVVLPDVQDKRRKAIEIRRALDGLPAGVDVIVTTPQEIAQRAHLVGTVLRPALREGRVIFERTAA